MATYIELRNLAADSDLLNRCDVAVSIEAYDIVQEATPTDDQVAWAQRVLRSPRTAAEQALRYVLAKNKDSSVAAITGASDATLQTAVGEAVAVLSKGFIPGEGV